MAPCAPSERSGGWALAPWRSPGRLGRALAGVLLGAVWAGLLLLIVVAAALAPSRLLAGSLTAAVLAAALAAAQPAAALERQRPALFLCQPIPGRRWPRRAGKGIARLVSPLRSAARWRAIAYLLGAAPLRLAAGVAVVAIWLGSLALAASPLVLMALPVAPRELDFHEPRLGWGLLVGAGLALEVGPEVVVELPRPGLVGIGSLLGAAALLLAAPRVTLAAARLDAALARSLLAAGRPETLGARIRSLEAAEAAARALAEVDRRRLQHRIEAGAMRRLARLVALLGATRPLLVREPAAAAIQVARALEEARAASADLAEVARLIRPVILADRGLDAALSALIARCPAPVALRIEPDLRLSGAVETAAYLVLAEALANVAAHARASAVEATVSLAGDRLLIEVRDDGRGGADPSGPGLRAVRTRAVALGGAMSLASPSGGPTALRVELPLEGP